MWEGKQLPAQNLTPARRECGVGVCVCVGGGVWSDGEKTHFVIFIHIIMSRKMAAHTRSHPSWGREGGGEGVGGGLV